MNCFLRNFIAIFLFFFSLICTHAKIIDACVFSGDDKEPISSAIVSAVAGDSIVMICQTDNNGMFSLNVPDSVYLLVVSAVGFIDKEEKVEQVSLGSPFSIFLERESSIVNLSDITVSVDRSQIVKRTSNGEIFFLSKEAMKEGNPFVALAEIPLLRSDYTTSTLKLLDGSIPLILIDGNQVNSGISPILPADIESVEVITAVPARYLQDGYNGIVNIHLKKNRSPYLWFGGSFTQNIPSCATSGPALNFEVGNERFSVYGAGIYHYLRDAKNVYEVIRNNTGYSQSFLTNSESRSDRLYGWLLLKYIASSHDYLAASIRYNYLRQRSEMASIGDFVTDLSHEYFSNELSKDINNTMSTNLYYRHSFEEYNDLEVNLNTNTDANKINGSNEETLGSDLKEYISNFRNSRFGGYLYVDYYKTWDSGKSLSVGNHLILTNDKINQTTSLSPTFHNRILSEYAYGSFGGQSGILLYNLSAGFESIWISAAGEHNNYFRPRVSASCTLKFGSSNSLNLAYTLTNQAPSTAVLNPLNTSTDPLIVNIGNPHLKPKMEHKVKLTYTLNKKGWYISPIVSYYNSRDLITPWGYTENGVFYNTYHNSGHYSEMNYLLNLSYNCSWLSLTAAGSLCAQYFQNKFAKWSNQMYLSLFARVKKFFFIAELNYVSKEYTDISIVRNHNPLESRLHISYNFTPDFYVAVGMRNYTGNIKTTTDLRQGAFSSHTVGFNKGEGRGFIPYISVYYNFRKNKKRKIIFENPYFEEEKGIKLK